MFNFLHPRPVVGRKPVAELTVPHQAPAPLPAHFFLAPSAEAASSTPSRLPIRLEFAPAAETAEA